MTQTKAELLQTRHQGDIRLGDADSTHYVGFKAPATVGTSLVWTLPAADGTANYLLKTDGSGNLGWVADSSTDSTKMPLAGGTFTGNVTSNDNVEARFGTGADFKIYHSGSHGFLLNNTGNLDLRSGQVGFYNAAGTETLAKFTTDGSCEFYYNNVKKVETTSAGAQMPSTNYFQFNAASSNAWAVGATTGANLPAGEGTALQYHHWNNSSWEKVSFQTRDGVGVPDNKKFIVGDESDLQIYHSGSSSVIDEVGSGSLKIQTNGTGVDIQKGSTETMGRFIVDGGVELYHNNVKTFSTDPYGSVIYGPEGYGAHLYMYADEGDDNADKWALLANAAGTFSIRNYSSGSWVDGFTLDGSNHATFSNNVVLNTDSYLKIGAGADLQLTHNGTHNYVNGTNGHLYLRADQVIVAGNTTGETIAQFVENGAAIFRYDNVVKFETTSAGTKFTGGIAQVATAAGALELDLNTSNYFTKTISGNSTFTFANPAASGQVTAFTLELTHSSGTVTWPSSVKWNADTAPTLTTGKTHLFMFVTDDGGTRYRGSALVDYVN